MTHSLNIQILSDLHLETPLLRPRYETFELPVKAPYLALLGDIGKTNQPELFSFITRQLKNYKFVFYLLGNHEAYRVEHEYSSYVQATASMRAFETEENSQFFDDNDGCGRGRGQFVFLQRTRFDIPDTNVTILGCTLFSHILFEQQESVALKVSDFSAFGPGTGHIDDWDIDSHNQAHRQDVAWLNKTVYEIENDTPDRHVVIFTHHSPTRLEAANDVRFLEDENQVNSAFVTDLSREPCWNSVVVKLWAFGHTHFNCDFVANRSEGADESAAIPIQVLTNQLGYFRAEEVPGFDENKTISLESVYTPQDLSQSNADLHVSGKGLDGGRSQEDGTLYALRRRLGVFWRFS